MKTHITYDARSGQIISVQHGPADAAHAQHQAHRRTKIAVEHIGVIEAGIENMQKGKLYKVDPKRKALVEAAEGENGSFFSGSTGRK